MPHPLLMPIARAVTLTALVVGGALAGVPAAVASTEAGELIRNRAEIVWTDADTGLTHRAHSNTSTVIVGAVRRFTLDGGNERHVAAGAVQVLPHRLVNTGNVPERYRLSPVELDGDAGTLDALAVHHDLDGDGVVDADEPVLERTALLAPGESLALAVLARVPGGATPGASHAFELRAEASDGTTLAASSTLLVTGGARLALERDVDVDCDAGLAPGERVVVGLAFVNRGSLAPTALTHHVDGTPREGVLVTAVVPDGLSLVPVPSLDTAPSGAVALVDTDGTGGSWTSHERWDGMTPVRRLAVLVPAAELAPGEGGRFAFPLRAAAASSGALAAATTAGIDTDGDGRDDVVAATGCTAPPALGPTALDASITFLLPAADRRRTGALPVFAENGDFVPTASYPLDGGRGDYDVGRDGLYLELRVDTLPDGVVLGRTEANGVSLVVSLESLGTGDSLEVVLLETFPGSGVFRAVRPIALGTAVRGDGGYCPGGAARAPDVAADYAAPAPACVLSSEPDDTLRVRFGDAGAGVELDARVRVAPIGTVFDSRSGEPVAGATIRYHRGDAAAGTNAPAVIDPLSGEPLVRVSDVRGVHEVPALPPGSGYHVQVEPPAGWRFPSTVAPDGLPDRDVLASAYGAAGTGGTSGVFAVAPEETTPLVDIPLDPLDDDARLTLAKRALATEVEPGGLVAYALEVSNGGDAALADVRVDDRPPYGFRLVIGTQTLDGAPVAVPVKGADGTLGFALGELAAGESVELGYVLEATAGAIDGDGINVARASASTPGGTDVASLEARARVRVERAGVLSDRAALFGKVYIDADCDGLHGDGEWPVGGVRLYLDDGTFAITDEDGQYSLYGLAPGVRVLRVDPISVPEGLAFKPLDNANAARGDSRFVTLSNGDFHRADFALACPLADAARVLAEVRERNADIDGTWLLEEADRFAADAAENDGTFDGRELDTRTADAAGDLSNGIVNGPDAGGARTDRRVDRAPDAPVPGTADASAAPEDRALDPEAAAATITAGQAEAGTWLWPRGDTSLDGRFVAVVRAGVEPTLYVDGVPVSSDRIGERVENRRERAQIVAWYGVALEPGPNRVEVRGLDPFGNDRLLAEGEFKRPAAGKRLKLRARTDTLPADGGRSALPIEVLVLDDNDYPAQGVHFVTLETDGTGTGTWLEADLRPDEPGHQIRVEDGRAKATLRSTDVTGTRLVRARADTMRATLAVVQLAALRPLFGVGLLELGVRSDELVGRGFAPTDQADGLDGGTRADARLSMFLKGRVRGDALLTLAYDSTKGGDTELFRDIDPGTHYPIHGDASVRGYEAQSRSPLYARLEKGRSSVLWGDYATDADAESADLARTSRVLTGFAARHDTGRARFQLFAARAGNGRRVEEIPGNGTAMLFRLDGAPIVPNSEIVERIVRDRDNVGLVVSVERLSRFGDYTLDSLGGEIAFAEPVPTFDEALNPVFVRVGYAQERGGDDYTVAGVRTRFALSEALVVGASLTDDDAPATGTTLGGAWLAWRPRERTSVTLAAARATHAGERAAGDAQRLAVEHAWGGKREARTSLVAARAEEGFDTGEAGVAPGRRELRLEHRQRLTPTIGAELEASHSEALAVEELRQTVGTRFERSLERWSVHVGARRIRQANEREDATFATALAGAERRFTVGGRAASANAEYERDVARASRDRLSFGATIEAHEHADLRARYERQSGIVGLSSLGGTTTTETFSLGVESDLIEDTRLYSEYRMSGGIGGRDLVTASGVRGSYTLAPGLTLSPALELVDTITGDGAGDGVALSVGASDTRNPNVRIGVQGEYRDGRDADYLGLRGSYAARLNLDWTGIVREDFRRRDPDGGDPELRHAFTLGLARRPRLGNRHHLLFQYQWKRERGDGEATDRDVHVLSTHQNLQLAPDLVLSGRLGGKRQTTFLAAAEHASSAWLADARAIWDIDRRWSLDLNAGVLVTGNGGRGRRHAFGVGLSHVLERDLLIELGYNLVGFRDEDLDPEGYDARGVRFGLRYKFDESAFGWLDGRSDDHP